jgi:hypothetical protein
MPDIGGALWGAGVWLPWLNAGRLAPRPMAIAATTAIT